MSATDLAAWWGAAVATVVLIWDIYKWRNRGAKIVVDATPNSKVLNVPGVSEDERFIAVGASNVGDLPTTIGAIAGRIYKSRIHKMLRRESGNFVVVQPGFGQGLPFVLNPGERWQGGISQTDFLEKFNRDGVLYCGVSVSTQQQPIMVRVKVASLRAA